MENNIREKAIEIVTKVETVVVSSIDENGYPRGITMSNAKGEGIEKIWLATAADSAKVGHYKQNNKASICYDYKNNGITLIGEMKIVEDITIKQSLWVDWFIDHFPEGVTDPNYCVLEFHTKNGILWIDNVFEKF